MNELWFRSLHYYWVVDQAEYATDLIFTSRESLAGLYSRLLDHATINFSASDILTFLGRRFHPRFDGEVLTSSSERSLARQDQARDEEQLAEDVRQVGLVLRSRPSSTIPESFVFGDGESVRAAARWRGA